jgi:hypothetical protein
MRLWNLNPFKTNPEAVNSVSLPTDFSWCTAAIGVGTFSHFITFQPERTTLSPESARNVIARILCYAILSRLPDDALPELSESLADMYFFYKKSPIQAKFPEITICSAKIGGSVTRAPIHLDDE